MAEKVKDTGILNTLDTIGCGCGGACEIKPLEMPAKKIETSHDHDPSIHVIESGEKKKSFIKFLKDEKYMMASFVIFFITILADFTPLMTLGLFLLAYILVAKNVLISAANSLIKGRMLDENFLMAIASIVAFAIGEYAEGVAVMLFYKVGSLTEDYALNRSKRSIAKLLDLKPDFANIKSSLGIKTVDPNDVNIGDIIVVKPGEKIPLDGVVSSGISNVDVAMLTGESLPQSVKEGTEVFSGTINLSGVLEIEVSKSFDDSAVSKILKLVQKAGENKADTEKFITKFAKIYTPLVVLGATLVAIIPPLFWGLSFDTWLYRGAIFLVVSCPCALVISVPLGYFGGIGGAARKGILVKGGYFLDVLKQPTTLVFDKTGTLTEGRFQVNDIDVLSDLEEETLKSMAAHLESYSTHPIAKAVVSSFDGVINHDAISNVREIPGKGIEGEMDGFVIRIGNDALMKASEIDIPENISNGTTLYISRDNTLLGIFHISDRIKSKSSEGLKDLRRLGVKKFIMLTGDRKPIADEVGRNLNIDEVYSELLPEDKLQILESLMAENKHVVFVGDGINDAPVLTRADVGIAMGALGSDVAIESSDVVLMTDEITKVAEAIEVAKFTSRVVWQNIIIALGLKLVIMVLGTLGIAGLWAAVFGDVGVAFIAILNSGRVIYGK